MDVLAMLAESKIRAAMARGEFENLPGHGKPLELEACSRVPAELRAGFRLLRNAGCLPPELEARKEIGRLDTLIAATDDPIARSRFSRLRAHAELRYQLLVEHRPR